MYRVITLSFWTTLLLLAACAPPPRATPLSALCAASSVDTSRWQRRSLSNATVLLPTGARPDRGTTEAEFYHGGGRWLDHDLVVQYGFINQDSPYGIRLPPDWIPAPPACWSPPNGLWDVRATSGRRNDRYYVQSWTRRLASTGHWLTVWADASDPATMPVLYAIVSSVQPDSTLFAQVR
jgi:hypothetical protein